MSRNLPFNPYLGVAPKRQIELSLYARSLMQKYAADGSINFTEFGNMLYDIMRSPTNTLESCNVWTTIARMKENYSISNVGIIEDNIDSFRPGTTHGHVVVGFDDGYHGPLAMLTIDEAYNRIVEHENNEGGIIGGVVRGIVGTFNGKGNFNSGDATASLNLVRALRKFRESGFSEFAREWNRRFLGK